MPKLKPLHSLFYNTQKVDLADVVTPPYDVINDAYKAELQGRSPYNFVHVILPKEGDTDYTAAKDRLDKWRSADVIKESGGARYYLYQQVFEARGKKHRRNTLMASVHLSDFSEGHVLPHEKIHQSAADDRMRILEKTQVNLSPIFAAIMDRTGFLEKGAERWGYDQPMLQTTLDDGVEHILWEVPETENAAIEEFFAENPIYIVDGHHRYTSALQFAKNSGTKGADEPSSYMYVGISNALDPAMVIFPTHRLVRGIDIKKRNIDELAKDFKIYPSELDHLKANLTDKSPDFGLYINQKLYHCIPKNPEAHIGTYGEALGKLAVVWSDLVLTKEIFGIEDPEKALEYVKDENDWWERRDQADAAILLPPLTMESIAAVSNEGGFMPQKSTYFYPKLAAGMILRQLR